MATLDLQVGASADDAHEQAGGGGVMNLTATEVDVRNFLFWGGVRFLSVAAEGTIDVAYMQIYPFLNDDPNLNIYGEDADDADTFTLVNWNITSRARTAAVAWSASNIGTAAFVNTPSLVSPVQTIVNRGGWNPNQDMAFLWERLATGLKFISWDSDPAKAAKLHIEYTAGGGPAARRIILIQMIGFPFLGLLVTLSVVRRRSWRGA